MNIEDIARLAGVSTATVSRVINNSPKVRPETAKRVNRIVEERQYIPNTSARSLRVGRTRLFALIVSDIKNPFFPELIDRFEELAARQGIDVVFTHTNYDPARLEHCLQRMVERNVDAIALMTSEIDPAALKRLIGMKMPLVLLNQPAAVASGLNTIWVDYTGGFDQAVDHLRTLGHREIAFLAGPSQMSSAMRRLDAFDKAMRKLKLKSREQLVVEGDFHIDGGRAAMDKLLDSPRRPTAVICANDLMAFGAIQSAHSHGLAIPRDISIIGFDNIDMCTMSNPTLTSIGLSRQEIATRAFDVLHKACSANRTLKESRQIVSTNLVVRNSTSKTTR
jgi:DNA-binding LacI/PurR family transcriptional regulator